MATLQDYVFITQRLLHDAQANYWPVSPDLINYINLARDRVCLDTACSRVLVVINLNANQELYPYSDILNSVLNLDPPVQVREIGTILNINCIQSSAYQPPLKKLPWTELNALYRSGGPLSASAFPDAYALYGYKHFYIANVPGDDLTAEVDCIFLPLPLSQLSDTEIAIPGQLISLVPLMAARWAEYYEDSPERAEKFMAHYELEKIKLTEALPHFSGKNW